MSARNHNKISTDGGDSLGANPFSELEASGLPTGELKARPSTDKQKPTFKKSKGRVEVRREKAGRGGKTVTTLKEFPAHIPLTTLDSMTFDLKKICACGGTLKGRVIELQGDVCDRVCKELNTRGFRPVRAGG